MHEVRGQVHAGVLKEGLGLLINTFNNLICSRGRDAQLMGEIKLLIIPSL